MFSQQFFFTPLSQQVIRNHISETEKSTEMRFFMKVYTQVGGEIGHSEEKICDPRDHRIISNLAH